METNYIRKISFNKYEQDFTFVVNRNIFKTSRFIADLISPNICKMHDTDGTINSFNIDIENASEFDFNKFLQFAEMKEIELSSVEVAFFMKILSLLHNEEQYSYFSKFLKQKISIENVFERIQLKEKLSFKFKKEIAFISSHYTIINYFKN